ncbi:MAG: hypothetical protein M1324_00785, partial [Patescibacteria group bacterium]|nr:hypothetical protein [Patescibacteria group bacterium]
IDFPIVSGFHKLTIQGQKEKILTPISDEVRFEISQAKGGSISMISDEDIVPPAPVKAEETSQPLKLNKQNALYLGALILGLAIIIILAVFFNSKRKNGQILKSLKNK